jgi:hypothetical protein
MDKLAKMFNTTRQMIDEIKSGVRYRQQIDLISIMSKDELERLMTGYKVKPINADAPQTKAKSYASRKEERERTEIRNKWAMVPFNQMASAR